MDIMNFFFFACCSDGRTGFTDPSNESNSIWKLYIRAFSRVLCPINPRILQRKYSASPDSLPSKFKLGGEPHSHDLSCLLDWVENLY